MTRLRVMATRRGEVGQVGIEEEVAGGTIMLGVGHVEDTRSVPERTADVV